METKTKGNKELQMEVVNGAGINDNPTRDSKQKIKARDKPERNNESGVGGKGLNNQVEVKHKLLCVNQQSRCTRGNSSNNNNKLRRLNESADKN